ncbi:hypothetical protein PGT21_011715 [Puccinia graminis f. sp. tritici]|uniref:Uncharacterized protein n=1 Tax=Puccinia graminis f. sp. tritici TaxID=56615 RepID=A0A5B0NUQ7_PUCGR|nr:hypothetical protein PGT21_011715 [Puccinia graminis f. sp. tritici]KAA1093804.1 hypothetical protein PGTUg99_030275 [Puccinia graminis f. sp. tritici]
MHLISSFLLIGTLITTTYINAILLKTNYDGHEYWILSSQHQFTNDEMEKVPFHFSYPLRQGPGSQIDARIIQNSSDRPIWVGSGLLQLDDSIEPLGGKNWREFYFSLGTNAQNFEEVGAQNKKYSLGYFVVISLDKKVDTALWKSVMKNSIKDLEAAVAEEVKIKPASIY